MRKTIVVVVEAAIAFIVLSVNHGYSRTWYIKADQSGDAPTIEAAVDSASSGDTILVAAGHYVENTLDIGKDLHLLGEKGAQETTIEMRTFFDYNLNVIIISGASSNSEVAGFTIKGGRGTTITSGAGIDLRNSATFIRDNIIYDNWCQLGGGISCSGGSPVIRKNTIYGNRGGEGCGIFIFNSAATIDSNTIAFNGLDCEGYVACGQGGAIFVGSDLPVRISNNIIAFNHAVQSGGIYCATHQENIIFECNLVYSNVPDNYDGELQDQTGVNGNISEDPQFCAVRPDSSGNFFLQSDSPCLAGNHPQGIGCGLIGAWERGCGSIGTEGTSWSKVKHLFKSKERARN